MRKKQFKDDFELLLWAHKQGVKKAVDDSIRTGVPLVFMKEGKIVRVKPKFKYVRVPIETPKKRKQTNQSA